MITAKGLSRSFGNIRAVDSLEFEIQRGEIVGLLGPNGAGKTTTIRMMSSYLLPSAGSVTVDGLDVVRDSLQVRRRIGYLPESAPLYTEMRVEEFLHFRGRLFGLPRSQRKTAMPRVIQSCRLESVRRRPIQQLSKGYRQRVGLAAALLHDPPVVILDEPTVGLDPAQVMEVRHLIRDLAGEHTVILSSHILPEVELTCGRVIMIAQGRIRADGTIEQLRQSAAAHHAYILEVRDEGAARVLAELPDVQRVQRLPLQDGWERLTLTARPSAGDLREAIGRSVQALGIPLRELRRKAPSLEHLFVQLTAGEGVNVAATDAGGHRREPSSSNPPVPEPVA